MMFGGLRRLLVLNSMGTKQICLMSYLIVGDGVGMEVEGQLGRVVRRRRARGGCSGEGVGGFR